MCFECVSKYTKKGVFLVNNLKCRKQGFNKLICRRTNKEVITIDCVNCPYKEYKMHNKSAFTVQKSSKSTKSLRKLEKNRFSLFTDDLEHCYFCGKQKDNLHEVIFGKNRKNSMEYGLVLPLCIKHHKLMHASTELIDEYKKRGQTLFEKNYPDIDFKSIFGKSYK